MGRAGIGFFLALFLIVSVGGVRATEDTPAARAEGSLASESGDQESVNIKVLQRDVVRTRPRTGASSAHGQGIRPKSRVDKVRKYRVKPSGSR